MRASNVANKLIPDGPISFCSLVVIHTATHHKIQENSIYTASRKADSECDLKTTKFYL
jgi:hypothetical protein